MKVAGNIAMVLGEVLLDAPQLAHDFFGIDSRGVKVDLEYRFALKNKNRIADLALTDKNGHLLVVVEIKFEDQNGALIEGQTTDYITFSRSNKCKFLLLCKHYPKEDILQRIEDGGAQ